MNRPFFSILIPCYNSEKYLNECFQSVVNQNCTNYEIICVDDGSQDNTWQILKKWKHNNKKIRIIHIKHRGVSFAFMRAYDERLGYNNKLTQVDQSTFNDNYGKYIQNYSTKLKERYYQNLDTFYQTENIASSTSNGYTSVVWLFKDDKKKSFFVNRI